jgi:hypothetical protein
MKEEKGKIVKNGEKKNTEEKIKPTKLWKRKNNEKKIKIGKETNNGKFIENETNIHQEKKK